MSNAYNNMYDNSNDIKEHAMAKKRQTISNTWWKIFITGLIAFPFVYILGNMVPLIVQSIVPITRMSISSLATLPGIMFLTGIMLLGVASPIVARLYQHNQVVRIIAFVCGTIAVILPYIIQPVVEADLVSFARISSSTRELVVDITKFILLIFALGELFYVQVRKDVLVQCKWSLQDPITYIIALYYLRLAVNLYVILMVAE